MQQFDDFQQAVSNLGTAVSELKAKAAALKTAIDQKVDDLGKQAAQDTSAAPAA